MRYLTRLRHIKLDITGNDLKSLGFYPSRKYKVVLESLFEKKLNGEIKSRQQEIEIAAKIYSEVGI